MSQRTSPCALKLGYTPTVFIMGRRQNIVIYSRCQGIAEWDVADTTDWKSEASRTPNSEGYYSYRLRPRWHVAVTNAEGIRFRLRPQSDTESELLTLTLEVIVENPHYPQLSLGTPTPPQELVQRVLALGLWLATAVLGLWAIADILTDIWPALLIALTGAMGEVDRQDLYKISLNCGLLLLSVVWLTVVLGGGEYHRRWLGQPNSWKLFGATLAAEGAILLIAFLV